MNQIPVIYVVAAVAAVVVIAFLFLRGMRALAFFLALAAIAAVAFFMLTGKTVESPAGARELCADNITFSSVLCAVRYLL